MHAATHGRRDQPAGPARPGAARAIKRAVDVFVAGGLLAVAFPLLLLVGVAIVVESGRPAVFKQVRIGLYGRPFVLYKLRSMKTSRETDPLRAQMHSTHDLNTYVFQQKNDPRVTRVGAFIRRSSLDELPQFYNVIRGEMSLVGPRPEVPEIVARYTGEQRRRLCVLPGLTGLAQVNGRGDRTVAESIVLDLRYVDEWSLWLDCKIVAKTMAVILAGIGAR